MWLWLVVWLVVWDKPMTLSISVSFWATRYFPIWALCIKEVFMLPWSPRLFLSSPSWHLFSFFFLPKSFMTSHTSNHDTAAPDGDNNNNNHHMLSSSSNDKDNIIVTTADDGDEHSQRSATKSVHASKPDLSTRIRNHFKHIFSTIFVKPQGRPPNLFKQLLSLNTKQRLAFAAGKFCVSYYYYLAFNIIVSSFWWLAFRFVRLFLCVFVGTLHW